MSDAAQKAIDVLVEIAEDDNADPDARIRAACAILDRLDKIPADPRVAA